MKRTILKHGAILSLLSLMLSCQLSSANGIPGFDELDGKPILTPIQILEMEKNENPVSRPARITVNFQLQGNNPEVEPEDGETNEEVELDVNHFRVSRPAYWQALNGIAGRKVKLGREISHDGYAISRLVTPGKIPQMKIQLGTIHKVRQIRYNSIKNEDELEWNTQTLSENEFESENVSPLAISIP